MVVFFELDKMISSWLEKMSVITRLTDMRKRKRSGGWLSAVRTERPWRCPEHSRNHLGESRVREIRKLPTQGGRGTVGHSEERHSEGGTHPVKTYIWRKEDRHKMGDSRKNGHLPSPDHLLGLFTAICEVFLPLYR